MARKNAEISRVNTQKPRLPKSASPKTFKAINPPSPVKGETTRVSPVTSTPSSSRGGSPRTSPGLVAGHYAGCKFTEPPSPSTLPKPPQHWTQAPRTVSSRPFQQFDKFSSHLNPHLDIAQQLKVLLKVQA